MFLIRHFVIAALVFSFSTSTFAAEKDLGLCERLLLLNSEYLPGKELDPDLQKLFSATSPEERERAYARFALFKQKDVPPELRAQAIPIGESATFFGATEIKTFFSQFRIPEDLSTLKALKRKAKVRKLGKRSMVTVPILAVATYAFQAPWPITFGIMFVGSFARDDIELYIRNIVESGDGRERDFRFLVDAFPLLDDPSKTNSDTALYVHRQFGYGRYHLAALLTFDDHHNPTLDVFHWRTPVYMDSW